ncbi:hypothetical protein G9A89_013402 [Geosiphon pyriformis]|nr:hypothetical protein G9A89_013402 [Geosiphon pyriformis]
MAPIYQSQPQVMYQSQPLTIYQPQTIQTPPQNLLASGVQRLKITQQNWRLSMVVHQPIPSSFSQTGSHQWNLGAGNPQNPNSQNYLSLLVTPEDTSPSNQEPIQKQQTHTNNILPAIVTNDESLNTIFPFKFKEPLTMSLFSGAALEEKPIIAMYTNAKIDGHHIKLILNSGHRVDQAVSTRIIMTDRATKTPISEIDDLPIKINTIIVPIKVLVLEATQYQALVGNDWLSKTNATLDWNTQELQLILWANEEHNELPPILSWDNNGKGKQTNELTWETNNLTWTDNEQEKPSSWEWKEEKGKGKEREEENTQANNTYIHTPTVNNNH